MQNVKLGKQAKKYDPRNLQLKSVLDVNSGGFNATMPQIPDVFLPDAILSSPFQIFGNDTIGDCTCAKAGNLEIFWSHLKGKKPYAPTPAQVIKMYTGITGYNPNDPDSDIGSDLLTVCNYWRKHALDRRKITAFGEIQLKNEALLKTSIFLFQNADLGIQVPQSMMQDVHDGQTVWDVPSQHSPIEGGHNIPAVGYTKHYIYVVSWGKVYKMTWEFYHTYADEAYALIGTEYMHSKKTVLNGISITDLQSYIANLD